VESEKDDNGLVPEMDGGWTRSGVEAAEVLMERGDSMDKRRAAN
jgi:hypothetical protein